MWSVDSLVKFIYREFYAFCNWIRKEHYFEETTKTNYIIYYF